MNASVAKETLSLYKEALEVFSNLVFWLGVPQQRSKRKSSSGVTNAELMFIHENGSQIRSIPPRPVLQLTLSDMTIEVRTKVKMLFLDYLRGDKDDETIKKELKILAFRIESHARKMIYDKDSRLAKNAESTKRRKGFDHPLFHTSTLARSIVCYLGDKEGNKV